MEFTGFPAGNCEKIKWQLTLYHDPRAGRPTTFTFRGTRATREGTWTLVRGTAPDPNATVYRLDPEPPHRPISFQKADDNILLLLDGIRRLMLGDASWSYTLNRTDAVLRQ